MFNRSGESGKPYLVDNVGEKAFRLSDFDYAASHGLVIYKSNHEEASSSIPSLLRVFFNHKLMLNLVEFFFCIN